MILPADEFTGRVIITWPAKTDTDVAGWGVTVTDAETGEPIVSALDCTIHVDVRESVVAEMTMLTTEDGKPLLGSGVIPILTGDGKDYLKSRFRWTVAEMRVAEVAA